VLDAVSESARGRGFLYQYVCSSLIILIWNEASHARRLVLAHRQSHSSAMRTKSGKAFALQSAPGKIRILRNTGGCDVDRRLSGGAYVATVQIELSKEGAAWQPLRCSRRCKRPILRCFVHAVSCCS